MPAASPEFRIIQFRRLRFDTENPRHRAQSDQDGALAALMRDKDDRAKLIALANDINRNGLDPINPLLVLRHRRDYIVLEGNRRLAALHLLNGRGTEHLASDQGRTLEDSEFVDEDLMIPCVVVGSREEARHWIELRHTGQNEGAGVVPWSAAQSARFRPGNTQAHKGLAFLELVRTAFPTDIGVEEACNTIERDKITNLGRLAGDPVVRERLGVNTSPGGQYELDGTVGDAAQRVRALTVSLAGDTSVAELINKDRRLEYIERVLDGLEAESPVAGNGDIDTDFDSSDGYESASPSSQGESGREEATESQAVSEASTPASPRSGTRRRVFHGLDLSALDERIEQINQETQSLSLEGYPNAVAILIRCLLDMAVESFLATAGEAAEDSFAKRVLQAAAILDPNDDPRRQDPRLRAVRAWMNAGDHLLSAATLHQFVHNPQWHPVPQDLVAIASNLQPFLAWINEEVTE